MQFVVAGINHKTAPIEIREKFYCTPAQQELLLAEFKSNPSIVEGLVLSTCNRTEIYSHTLHAKNADDLLTLLFEVKGLRRTEQFKKCFYIYSGEEAVRHFFNVTVGLDSLIMGEKQILGQVKEAVELARRKTMLGKYLNILSNMAVRTGKKAQSETDISFGGCSISWAAVVMAEKMLGDLKEKSVLVIGAGKMGETALTQMQKKGARDIYIMNRTESCALELANRLNGEAVSFGDIKEVLTKIDVCICSVGAPHYILDKSTVEKVMIARNNKKILFIDISMPRNIDPEIAHIPNVLLFHIDDLDKVVGDTMKKRQASVLEVEKIILEKITSFNAKINKIKDLELTGQVELKST